MKIDTPILRRLGPIPFWRGEQRCLATLEDIYRRSSQKAEQCLGRPEKGSETGGFGSFNTRRP